MSEQKVDGISIRPNVEQHEAWSAAAGESPLAEWLTAVADEAAARSAPVTWPMVIELKVPIVFGSQTIETLKIRRGQLSDIKGMRLGGDLSANDLMTIASRISGQPTNIIERLDMEDAGEVMAAALSFYAKFLKAGKT
jgi:Phage tail assembly chaperone proteins, E, or 41 or 14